MFGYSFSHIGFCIESVSDAGLDGGGGGSEGGILALLRGGGANDARNSCVYGMLWQFSNSSAAEP